MVYQTKYVKQDNVQANSESVQCHVFQIRKVFDHQHRHFGVIMHFLTVNQAHILYTLWSSKKLAVTLACIKLLFLHFLFGIP